ncbi:tRNA (N6-threonylcarbamoyladenosine(37)-N6)-methyltransferase TrmO [Amycolatopsis sp. SID8362]|uniref:tRNA (N6-threonylcarbamoyladenosine(37)-N6)-methyltransferase TrmO n=1 Tax=Amycolatopsis sp. SID8362 TaxID=2690346 RepID=UPI001EF291E1|nr:tRNA (N6-threonylcarbamoyladenosine(37)-N6)-methyltransferase TrmO [Amycolatopsis sp. SID8362]
MRRSCPLTVIGVVRSVHTSPEHTPVQSALNPDEHAVVEVFPAFVDGLLGLAGFDWAWLLTWLDQTAGTPSMRQIPFLLRPRRQVMGMFATRSPDRVNPLGLSLVRVLGVEGESIRFAGVDLLDGTPVVDVKPWVGRFDRPGGGPRSGWYDTVPIEPGVRPADLGPPPDAAFGKRAARPPD